MSNENQVNVDVKSDGSKKEPRQPHILALNGFGALLCLFAAILAFMGSSSESTEIGSLKIVNLPLFVGVAAFACFLTSVISLKLKWKSGGVSAWIKSGVLVFLVLVLSLVYFFRDPAYLAVIWDRVSPLDATVHHQYRVESDYYSYHSIGHDRVRYVGFFGARKSFYIGMDGNQYASCLSSGEACELKECLAGQIWWLGGLQLGIETERDSNATGESKALTCQSVDAKTVTPETYDEYGYRYE